MRWAIACSAALGLIACNTVFGLEPGQPRPDAATDDASDAIADMSSDAADETLDTSAADSATDTVEVAVDAGSYTFTFPTTGEDTDMLSSFDTMCDKGTYVEGTRITDRTSLLRLTGTFELVANNLLATCPALPTGPVKETLEFHLNDTLVGKVAVDSTSGTSLPVDLDLKAFALKGPNVKLKILAAVDVPSGCGCIEPAWNKSKYTLY